MSSGLGHWLVWYMVMSFLEDHSGYICKGHQMMEAACPDQNLISTGQIMWSHNPQDYNF
jgi:hypothetical protein